MAFVAKMASYLRHFERSGFEAFRSAFDAVHLLHQRDVVVHSATEGKSPLTHGRVEGVGGSGQLLIRTPRGLEEMLGGEVSLRPADHWQ
jgi:biotin-(acetyl-CoA carboxylase) ligase